MRLFDRIFLGFCALCAVSLSAFDARYTPTESDVSWRAPEGATDKAATIFSQPSLGNVSLMAGEVQVDGDPDRPFIARLDSQGNVEWSKRLPSSVEELYDNISLAEETHMMVAFQALDGGLPVDRLGSFNPENGFSAKFTKSLPALAPDPFNPFSGGRSYQIQRAGKVAIVELQGAEVDILLLDTSGDPVFARTYTLPSGGDSPFPIPGTGLSYSFAAVTELANGDFYMTTVGTDIITQSLKAIALRLNNSGNIIWQRIVDLPGTIGFAIPRADESILISSNLYGESSVSSNVILLNATGQELFARSVSGVALNNFSFEHFLSTGNILLQGNIFNNISGPDLSTDGAVLILSDSGTKVAEAAYDLSENDSLVHVGTINDQIYFELFGISGSENGEILTHGILARTDATLENWLTRSYKEVAGPSALFSAFFTGAGSPFLTYRDVDPDWINVSKLDANLQELGECQVMADTSVVPYDPDFSVTPFSATVANVGVTEAAWSEAPVLTDAPFVLEDTPLTVEFVCGNGVGPVDIWADIPAVNEQGDKKTGIGWINADAYPFVWHYTTVSWLYIAEGSDTDLIYGYNVTNGFWFAGSDLWAGWYVNLEDPGWHLW